MILANLLLELFEWYLDLDGFDELFLLVEELLDAVDELEED